MPTFTTPHRHIKYGLPNPLWWAEVVEGYWVVKTAEGTWRQLVCPTPEFIKTCQASYQGGMIHEITQAQADELTAGGYGSYVTT